METQYTRPMDSRYNLPEQEEFARPCFPTKLEHGIQPRREGQSDCELLRKSNANLEQSSVQLQEVQSNPQHQWEQEVLEEQRVACKLVTSKNIMSIP